MAAIRFESFRSHFKILNPFQEFAEEEHQVEVRRDPLLGDTSVYNPYLKDKAKFFFGENDAELIRNLVEESAKTCIFCEERVEKSTTKYPSDILPEGRMKVGEAVLFPNLFAIGKYHPVISLCKAHFLRLSEFSPLLIGNGLRAAREFLNTVYGKDTTVSYAVVNANYLFPAGASLVHPHLQMLITPIAYSYQARLMDAARSYQRENGSSYCADLVDEEKKIGERYITQKGRWHWMTAYSPMGSNEVLAVHEDVRDFGLLSEADLQDLSYGISKVLAFYEGLGHLSYNFSIFSVRGSSRGDFPVLLKMVNRQNLYPNYRNDDYFLQKLIHTELIIHSPEELAPGVRNYF